MGNSTELKRANLAALKHLLENGNVLEQVRYEMFNRRMVSRIFLAFSGGVALAVEVDPDTDQIVVSDHRPEKKTKTEDASSASPWRGAIGKPLYAAWVLENHNGHADALQLDFRGTAREEPRIIQMYGAGTTVWVSVMVETN